jgi:hypothetical protein
VPTQFVLTGSGDLTQQLQQYESRLMTLPGILNVKFPEEPANLHANTVPVAAAS